MVSNLCLKVMEKFDSAVVNGKTLKAVESGEFSFTLYDSHKVTWELHIQMDVSGVVGTCNTMTLRVKNLAPTYEPNITVIRVEGIVALHMLRSWLRNPDGVARALEAFLCELSTEPGTF